MIDAPTSGRSSSVAWFVIPAFILLLPFIQVHAQTRHAPELLDVVALRVEFQPDTTRFTTGNGTFAGPLFEGVEPPSIDPFPHDATYFDAHLRFLENYIDHVSDGRTLVRTHLLPNVVRVSGTMGQYSPTGPDSDSDAELAKLAALIGEAWAGTTLSGFTLPADLNPENTAFVIFHAGVGRDIELVGTSLDKTPEDLPSIYFSDEALGRLGVSGISVDGLAISNTMVIPRTESRLGFNFLTDEPFLIELSINGMLAASFLNYLGVPDLFNTVDGESAIGPFGVMDALGIFAFSGLFPPEPSAWTKHFLGWTDPILVGPGQEVSLKASGDADANDVGIVPISDAEYFLVENRHRDPNGDGVNLRVWTPQGEQTVHFDNADPEFNDQTVSGFPGGVVVSVDDYDFVLPGGVDENDNPLMGGILIWHVDENRLSATISDNAVNADREARSIDLEEADGAQDIGYTSGGGFFGPSFNLGTPFDFWYEGNPVTVRTNSGQDIQLYENRFSSDTTPASTSNGGGLSGIELRDFSAPGPVMTFRRESINVGGPSLLAEWMVSDWAASAVNSAHAGSGLVWQQSDPAGFFLWHPTTFDAGQWIWQPAAGAACSSASSLLRPVFDGSQFFVVQEDGVWSISGLSEGCERNRIVDFSGTPPSFSTSRMEWVKLPSETRLFLGAQTSQGPGLMTIVVNGNGNFDVTHALLNAPVTHVMVVDRQSADVFLLTDSGVLDGQGATVVPMSGQDWEGASMTGTTAEWTLAWQGGHGDNGINLLTSEGVQRHVPALSACAAQNIVWYDVDQDGWSDLIFTCGESIIVAHETGAVHSGFPVRLSSAPITQPVAGRTSTGKTLVLVGTEAGVVEAVEVDGFTAQSASGFPLAIGRSNRTAPLLTSNAVIAVSGAGSIRAWDLQLDEVSNASDSGLLTRSKAGSSQITGNGLLINSETYNWPNPITNGETRIRFAVSDPSEVDIVIVDMAGMEVGTLSMDNVMAGIPHELTWQTSAGSGIYLARVRARGLNGQSDTRLIRMAIIR